MLHSGSLPSERSLKLLASQHIKRSVTNLFSTPFPDSDRYSAATIQHGYMHLSVSSLVVWTAASNSGQNYSPCVFEDRHSHVGLEVQLLALKASPCSPEELFT